LFVRGGYPIQDLLRKDPWNLIRIIPAKENDVPSRRLTGASAESKIFPLRIIPTYRRPE
jgi:hypothetical protein|tara:strand:- start:7994 stop:8170 length:177 start_codon:yes stop_codon:yes gene_type:complete